MGIVVGPDQTVTQQRFEQHFTTTVTRNCEPTGFVGTLVVTPGGERATIVVAAGVQLGGLPAPDPTACADPANAGRCIIARRSFSFVDHTSLDLPVELDPLCIGKVCDPASTCFAGSCVNATVTCNGTDCGLPQERPGEGNGGANEAGSSDGAYDADLDAAQFEDVSILDSGDGAKPDSSVAPPRCEKQGASRVCIPATAGVLISGGCGGGSGSGSGSGAGSADGVSCCLCSCVADGMIASCDISMGATSCIVTCP